MRRHWVPSSKVSAALIAAILIGLPLRVHTQDAPATLSEDLAAFLESGSNTTVETRPETAARGTPKVCPSPMGAGPSDAH